MVKASVRGGAEMRKLAANIDKQKRASYPCPSCGKAAVRRISNAVWKCRSCSATFAGGAYNLSTPMGGVGNKALDVISAQQKSSNLKSGGKSG